MRKVLGFILIVLLFILAGKYIVENHPQILPKEIREWAQEVYLEGENALEDSGVLEEGERLWEESSKFVENALTAAGDALEQKEGLVGYEIEEVDSFHTAYPVEEGDFVKTFPVESLLAMSIEVSGCILEISPSDGAEVELRAERAGKAQVYEEEGCLYTKVTRTALENGEECRLSIRLPQRLWQKIWVKLGAGTVKIEELKAEELICEIGGGKLEADHTEATKLQLDIGAGLAVLKEMSVGKLTAKVGAGSLQFEGAVSHLGKAECAAGTMELALEGREEDFNYTVECVGGSVSLGGEKVPAEIGKKWTKEQNALKELELSCAVGSIDVSFAE